MAPAPGPRAPAPGPRAGVPSGRAAPGLGSRAGAQSRGRVRAKLMH